MRYILLFIHALAIIIYQFFFADPVTLKTNFPETAKPGTQFIAEVTIFKGALSGFAKFQIELPDGFTAEESDSKGGTFSMAGQTAKIIWTSVPSSSDVTVKILIKVDASANGDKTIQGKYSYIENNVKQQIEFTPVTIKVNAEAVVTNTTTEPVINPEVTSQVVSVVRTIVAGKSAGVFEVELKIKKDAAKGFAKLQEKIPGGYMAVEQKTDGSAFSFSSSDQIAKFIWTSLPSQEELVISYKIIPKQGAEAEKPAFVEGEFNYLDNQDSKKYDIAKEELVTGTSSEPVVTNTEPVNTNTVAATEPVNTYTETAKEPVTTETVAATTNQQTEPTNTVNPPKNAAITYVVQVGAFKKSVNVSALSTKFGLSGVRTEMQDGFTKCIFGKHDEYKSARDSRETTKSKGVTDAFVAAYNSGQRITVQEALMITSQKWYR